MNLDSPHDIAVTDDDASIDDQTLYEDITSDELELRQNTLNSERLPCFAHSLQLTICNGLQKTHISRVAVAKCTKIANLTHQSSIIKTIFEETFGKYGSIPLSNNTRLNSFY